MVEKLRVTIYFIILIYIFSLLFQFEEIKLLKIIDTTRHIVIRRSIKCFIVIIENE